MSTKYMGVWTEKGLKKLARYATENKTISFTQLAIGDGNGSIPEPSADAASLVHEVWRGNLNNVANNPDNEASVLVEIVIPYNVGGFFVREWGIYDNEGDLLVYGNHAEFYKAQLAEGTGAELRELVELPITNKGVVEITVSYEALASVDFVNKEIIKVLQALDDHDSDENAHANIVEKLNKQIELSAQLKQIAKRSTLGSWTILCEPNKPIYLYLSSEDANTSASFWVKKNGATAEKTPILMGMDAITGVQTSNIITLIPNEEIVILEVFEISESATIYAYQ